MISANAAWRGLATLYESFRAIALLGDAFAQVRQQ